MKLFFLAIFFSLTSPILAHDGIIYYVAKTGSNNYSCAQAQSAATPKATLTGADGGLKCLAAGSTLIIKEGTYAEAIGPRDLPSGTSWSSAVTLKAAPGESVTLQPTSGADVVWFGSVHYIILDGLLLDARHVSSQGIRFQALDEGEATTHHIRVLNTEVRYAKPGYGNRTNGANCIGFFWRYAGVHSVEMRKLKLHDCGTTHLHHGAYIVGHNNVLEESQVYNNSGHGIHVYDSTHGGVDNNIVRNNKTYNNGSWGILIGSGANNLAYNNLVWGNGAREGAGGMRIGFGNPTNNQIYNNTIYASHTHCVHIRSGSSKSVVKNNICWQNGNNTTYDQGSGSVISQTLTSDPQFMNAAGGDFRIRSTSPAINQGTTLSQVPFDYMRMPRPQGGSYDIGAYEYVSGTSSTQPAAPTNLRIMGAN